MKTILEESTRLEIINRIHSLNELSMRQWGKMNIYQMLKHCTLAEEFYLGQKKYPRSFLGKLIGKWALKGILKNDDPMGKNAPTSSYFKVKTTTGDVASERAYWITLIEAYANYENPAFEHWFFGEMTTEQLGFFVYKHADHHLRQFNS